MGSRSVGRGPKESIYLPCVPPTLVCSVAAPAPQKLTWVWDEDEDEDEERGSAGRYL